MFTLLPKDRRITEKSMMEFQPFGKEPDGTAIRDLSGVVMRACVEYLEELVAQKQGSEAGRRAVEELVGLLNERIPDRAFYVTAKFLRNPWNSYSSEFSAFFAQFCVDLSRDQAFHFSMARDKAISPIIQVLGRPFSVPRIYQMSPYFSQRYSKNSFYTEAVRVSSDHSATIRMFLTDRARRQFNLYLRACAEMWCHAHKGYFVGVPTRFHGLPLARIADIRCIAEGDDHCEWEVAWSPKERRVWPVLGWLTSRRHHHATGQPQALAQGPARLTESDVSARPLPAPQDRLQPAPALLSKDHPITEKGMMEFQPFGIRPDGTKVRDMAGITISACVEYLQELMSQGGCPEIGKQAVEELVRRLNERIPDHTYCVTADMLKNPWNSYAMEFAAFFAQFCVDISGEPQFHFNMAREKVISTIIQALGRPFAVAQIYKLSPYFAHRYYDKDIFFVDVLHASDCSALLRMRFGERTYQQFGPYLRGCARHWCVGTKGYFVGVPEIYRRLPPATVTDRRCLVEGDDCCEWEVTWSKPKPRLWPMFGWVGGRRSAAATEQPQSAVLEASRPTEPFTMPSLLPPAHERSSPTPSLLPKERRIIEKGMMECRPFGKDADGQPIRDHTGIVMKACVDYLEEYVGRTHGEEAGKHAVEELVCRLNERIPDRLYHVTSPSLRNPWNSYSFEFAAFKAEFCRDISQDSQFTFKMAREKVISPIIQALGRLFSIRQIYKLSPHFAQRFHGNHAGEEVYTVETVSVSDHSAILRMTFKERAYHQFGPYLRACAKIWCDAHKGYFVAVPEQFHHAPAATVTDRTCIAEGDDCCEWEVVWAEKKPIPDIQRWSVLDWLAGQAFREETAKREKVIEEQLQSLDSWQEELKEAYVQQQQLTADLQRKVDQLTTLHEASAAFT
ncbi:MAG: hypothetical protein EPO64_12645, partial [Nitrospirae bacterium]